MRKDELIRMTGEMAKVGAWEFDPVTLQGTWTDEVAKIHDLDPSQPTDVQKGLSFYSGESRRKIEQAVKEACEQGRPYDLELELTSAKGVQKWVRAVARPIVQDGRTVKVRGVFQDITELKQAHDRERVSAQKYREIFTSAPIGIFQSTVGGKFLSLNAESARMFGYESSDEMMKSVTDIRNQLYVIPEERDEMLRAVTAAAGKYVKKEMRYRHRNGSKIYGNLYARLIKPQFPDSDGQMEGFIEDVTEHRRSEDFARSRLAILLLAEKGSLDELMEGVLNEIERLTDSYIGFYHFIEDDQKTLTLQNWSTRTKREFCIAPGKGRHYDIDKAGVWAEAFHERKPVIHSDYDSLPNKKGLPPGHARVKSELVVPVLRGDKVVALLGVGNKQGPYSDADVDVALTLANLSWDIVANKRTSEILLKTQDRMMQYMEVSDILMLALDHEGNIATVNRKGCEILGYTREELIGRDWFTTCLPAEDQGPVRKIFDKLMAGAVDVFEHYENIIITKSGQKRNLVWHNSVIRDDAGRITGTFSSAEDVTALRAAEQNTVRANERIELATRAAHLGIWDWDVVNNKLVWDDRMFELYGVKKENFAGAYEAWANGLHPDDRARSEAAVAQALQGEKEYDIEFRVVWPDGSVRYTRSVADVLRDADGKPLRMIGVNYDITEQKRTEEVVMQNRRRLEMALEVGKAGIWEWDQQTNTVAFDDRFHALLGYAPGELPTDLAEWLTYHNQEDVPVWMGKAQRYLKGETPFYESEHRIRGKNGKWEWVFTRGQLEKPSYPGAVVRKFVGIAMNITARKEAEVELAKHREHLEELVKARTEALAASNRELEAFSYSVSHDLRAPLRHIIGFANLLRDDIGGNLSSAAAKHMTIIISAAQNMSDLIERLLSYTRLARAQLIPSDVSLAALVAEARNELSSEIAGRNIEWEIGDIPVVKGDPVLLKAAIVNLLSNAVKFTRGRKPARIEVFAERKAGETVLTVKDNGAGFDMQYLPKLFGVFQRLHSGDEFEGFGIGLSNVRRIVEKHGGRVWAEAEPGKGAVFHLALPDTIPSQPEVLAGSREY